MLSGLGGLLFGCLLPSLLVAFWVGVAFWLRVGCFLGGLAFWLLVGYFSVSFWLLSELGCLVVAF